ncbi:hypothetical protein ATY89_08125 [Sulfolobus acidocaldarius]|nr:hypothetical protein SacN8_09850 [Sulfolobus acidocaldarius N8]AGE74199.1 hypothetical protein SacRon12I_09870 [Sulfolobus acidocaldarius Ron12/I]ALU29907.1 hypothetical protein ATY89_08125 [Sulfolobus acidocaldarius]ALU32648.1 hypothetical protein ATZ20_11145 [Sulfolobus acidocaldarius]WCM35789.1 hypothetical protein GO597_10840 [Sulfolobus acidocaldarius DSM 639]
MGKVSSPEQKAFLQHWHNNFILKLHDRDICLIRKTAKYYLQYRRADTLSRLKGLLGEVEKVNLEDTERTIASYLAYSATRTVNMCITSALRDLWIRREYTIHLGDDIVGVIDVARSVPYYPFYYASLLPNLKMDELSYLSYIARKVMKLAIERLENSKVIPFPFFKEMKKEIKRLRQKLELLPSPSSPLVSDSSPDWLKKAYFAYVIAEKPTVGVRDQGEKIGVKLVLSKLYELFVYMLVARVLESSGFSLSIDEGSIKVKDANIVIIFNAPPSGTDVIERIDELDPNKEINYRIRGRPDISIRYDDRELILIECKYSEKPSYITEGRFKVMAYTYEYGAGASLLVFPGIGEGVKSEEEFGTLELYRLMGEKGWVDIRLRDGRKIYMVKVDPLEDTNTLLNRMSQVLLSILSIKRT